MKKNEETLASEIIAEIQNEKHTIITELECMDADFEKTLFVLNNALESTGQMGIPETKEESLIQHYNICNVDMQLNIVNDYVLKLQSTIDDIVAREYKRNTADTKEKQRIEGGMTVVDYKKCIHEMIEAITDEPVLKVICDFVELPYGKKKLKNEGSGQDGLQKDDY